MTNILQIEFFILLTINKILLHTNWKGMFFLAWILLHISLHVFLFIYFCNALKTSLQYDFYSELKLLMTIKKMKSTTCVPFKGAKCIHGRDLFIFFLDRSWTHDSLSKLYDFDSMLWILHYFLEIIFFFNLFSSNLSQIECRDVSLFVATLQTNHS